MLTSITPLGERGRGQRWPITTSWLLAGHVIGGFGLGATMAAAGLALDGAGLRPAEPVAVFVVAGLVVVAAAVDLGGRSLPGRRQVDERWLTRYRGWVYGLGFGTQLGFGLVTVVNTALVIPLLVTGALGSSVAALALGTFYGTVRGLGAVAGAGVRSVEQLRRLHRGLDASESFARIGGAVLVTAAAVSLAFAA